MLINQKLQDSKGSFYVDENGIILAEMTYSISKAILMNINHTKVSEALTGKNVCCQLVHTAVEYARVNHIKILPHCTFAEWVFDKKGAEFADVLSGN